MMTSRDRQGEEGKRMGVWSMSRLSADRPLARRSLSYRTGSRGGSEWLLREDDGAEKLSRHHLVPCQIELTTIIASGCSASAPYLVGRLIMFAGDFFFSQPPAGYVHSFGYVHY